MKQATKTVLGFVIWSGMILFVAVYGYWVGEFHPYLWLMLAVGMGMLLVQGWKRLRRRPPRVDP